MTAAIHLAGSHQHRPLLQEALQLHRFSGASPPSLVFYHTLVEPQP